MTTKKTIILLVEGICELTVFEKAMATLKDDIDVKIIVMDGDPLTNRDNFDESVKKIIGNYISATKKQFHLEDADILFTAQLTDTDGVFVGEEDIIIDKKFCDYDNKGYEFDTIRVNSKSKKDDILKRNAQKLLRINILSKEDKIAGAPYRLYYFSCNLDHIIYNVSESRRCDKTNKSTEFSKKYADYSSLKNFFNKPDIAINGDFNTTWDYLRIDENSLKRGSNVHLLFNEIDEYLKTKKNAIKLD